jgi:hypothetical protein
LRNKAVDEAYIAHFPALVDPLAEIADDDIDSSDTSPPMKRSRWDEMPEKDVITAVTIKVEPIFGYGDKTFHIKVRASKSRQEAVWMELTEHGLEMLLYYVGCDFKILRPPSARKPKTDGELFIDKEVFPNVMWSEKKQHVFCVVRFNNGAKKHFSRVVKSDCPSKRQEKLAEFCQELQQKYNDHNVKKPRGKPHRVKKRTVDGDENTDMGDERVGGTGGDSDESGEEDDDEEDDDDSKEGGGEDDDESEEGDEDDDDDSEEDDEDDDDKSEEGAEEGDDANGDTGGDKEDVCGATVGVAAACSGEQPPSISDAENTPLAHLVSNVT